MTSVTADSSSIEVSATAEARGRRPVWNVPSNGAIEVGPVMGAVSWPALSESATAAKASPKSSSSDSLKSLSDGSASAASPGPLISPPIAKPANSAPSPNPIQNPMLPTRQKSLKRGGSGNSGGSSSTPTNGGVGPALLLPVSTDIAQTQPDMQGVPEPSPRGSRSGGSAQSAQQPHGGGDQHRGYGGNRRGNHGGGSHHNHGNRRDQEWNHHRNAHVQHQHPQQQRGGLRMYPRQPSPVSAPFIPPLRSFVGNAVGFPDVPPPMYLFAPQLPPESLRGIPPFVPHPIPHAMLFPAMDQQRAALLKQIEYYFSNENLCKDVYLRQNMDEQGWVSISLIAGFNRVRQLTNNTQYILDTVRLSTLVEVQGEKIRRRNDWMNWLLIPSNQFGSTSSSGYEAQLLTTSAYEAVAARLQNVGLEGAATNHNGMRGSICGEVVLTRSASGNLNNQFQVVGDPTQDGSGSGSGSGSGQFNGFSDSDRSKSSRSLSRSDTL